MILFINGVRKMKKKEENQEKVKVIDSTGENPETISENPNLIALSKVEPDKPFDEVVEEERKKLFKVYKSTTTRNNIIMVIVVAIFIGAFIAITRGQIGQIIGWVLVGVTVAGLFVYYFLTRNLYPNTSKRYFHAFWKATNEYLFNQEDVSNCQIDSSEKYQLPDILADKAYKDILDIASRNIVHGQFKAKPFTFGELALYRAGLKKRSREVVFVGRHLSLENNLKIEGRYIVNIKSGEKPLDLPTDIDDLKPVVEQNNFVIYGLEGSNPEKDLGKELIESLKSIECTGALLNVNVVFWAGRTACYLSYDDAIVAIPFEKPINVPAYQALKKNIEDMFDILAK